MSNIKRKTVTTTTSAPKKRQRQEGKLAEEGNVFHDEDEEVEEEDDIEEELEEEDDEQMDESQEEKISLKSKLSVTKVDKPLREYWKRKDVDFTTFDPQEQSLCFQQLDADYYVGKYKAGFPGIRDHNQAIVRLYGSTAEGHSVLCNVRGFVPYFYIEKPPNFNVGMLENFKELLAKKFGEGHAKKQEIPFIVQLEITKKKSILHYQFDEEKDFIVIYTGIPAYVKGLRSMLEKGLEIPGIGYRKFLTYESNILFVLRCMIDANVVGANWIELPKGKYNIITGSERKSHCQFEVEVSHEELISHEPMGYWQKIAPLRILSFDIECCGKKGHFPSPQHDPVIQIANYVTLQGDTQPFIKNVFVLGTCSNIVGADVHCFKTEQELLSAWRNFVITVDPDILTGYNIINFDIAYLLERAKTLKIALFSQLGRIAEEKSKIRNKVFSSKAYGTRESKDANIEGRVQLDILQVIQRDYKLTSYSLNSVSATFLGEQKEEVHHSIISDLHNGDEETRRRLASYCLKDAYLPQRLLEKLMILFNYIEMARVTGIPLGFILQRGQTIKVISQLLRKSKEKNFIMPTFPREKTEGKTFAGAYVIPPKAAFYSEPITTLDFASLYPSIMIAHNLCYTTLVRKQDLARLKPNQYAKSPTGDAFVKAEHKKGLLPEILEELLKARKVARADLAKETDPQRKAVLNGRQLALKVSANSVYGFTGATVGQLPCLEISASVTAFGRDMILFTKQMVEEKYTIKNGYSHNATVIYGDTDSVMVKFGTKSLEEAMKFGEEASQFVTEKFIKPIKLEFEKVYYPYLLIAKKRYAGLLWTNTKKHDKLDAKGIEVVRRDTCPLVKNVINTCLHLILVKNDPNAALNYCKTVISDLLMNRLDISMLVVSKSLSKKSEDYTAKQAHVELAKRMQIRDPSTAPHIGDRVPYVIVRATKNAKGYEKSEDPIWVLENNIPIDAQYYLKHYLTNPLLSIFTPIMGKKAQELFSGDHTRNISIATPKTGGIMKFAKTVHTCLKCKASLPNGDKSALCKSCQSYEAEVYQDVLQKRNHYDNIYSRVWTHCQRCQGSLHQDVLCTNRDCPVFYMRKMVQKHLIDAQIMLDRFSLDW